MKMILPLQPPLIGGFPARHVAMFDSLVFEWSFYLDSPRNGIDPNSWPLKNNSWGSIGVETNTLSRNLVWGKNKLYTVNLVNLKWWTELSSCWDVNYPFCCMGNNEGRRGRNWTCREKKQVSESKQWTWDRVNKSGGWTKTIKNPKN